MQTVTTESKRSTATFETLDTLSRRSYADLGALYRRSSAPTSVRPLDGTPKGRMLAIRALDATPLAHPVRAFAASSSFVWDGKSFTSTSDTRGNGINRIQIPGALGRQDLFPFETFLGRSAYDDGDAFILNYDLAVNPPWIRAIHDEVREVSPGVFFGPAMVKRARGAATALWFALDARKR